MSRALVEESCMTCSEDPEHVKYPLGECPQSRRACGHHCNCSWDQDCRHWCGVDLEEVE